MVLNGAPRAAAAADCSNGLAGLITGHTHQPELAAVPGGFYANSGCGVRCVEARRARFLLPPVFVPVLRRCWVELDVDRDIRVRLILAESPTGESTWLERILTRLVDYYGWDGLARVIDIKCFRIQPSVKSSLTFLRKTPWARRKLEAFYLSHPE